MKIAITGGHMTPALAVIEELQKNKTHQIIYFGRKYSFEGKKTLANDFQIVSKIKSLKYVNLNTGRLQRKISLHTLPSLLRIPKAVIEASQILKREKVDCILSFGGYLAFPVALAGFLKKIPVYTHEQTVGVGLSNRFISHFSKKIFLSWPSSQKYFPEEKSLLVGNPVRGVIFKTNKTDLHTFPFSLKQIIDVKLRKPETKLIYISGGNQGSHIINQIIWQMLSQLLDEYYIIHQCGYYDWETFSFENLSLNKKQKQKYYLTPWIDSEQIGWVYKSADLIISRSGANTVTEIAALGKPAIFIPIPWVVDNEQQKNAEMILNAGFAKILNQNDLKEWQLKKALEETFLNLKIYQEKGTDFRKEIHLDAAAKIIASITEI